MSFTPRQQGLFRPMVTRAWAKHAEGNALDVRNRAAKDAWYRAELVECLGRDTTKDCDAGRDFELVMAHFEAIAGGDFHWNLRVHQGDCRRLQFSIAKICQRWDIDDAYARATAARVLKWPGRLESLAEITNAGDLQKVRIALLIHARRHGNREDHAAAKAVNAPAEPRAPVICKSADVDLRDIDPHFGATETEFESDGVRQRREAREESAREFRKVMAAHHKEHAVRPQRPKLPKKSTPTIDQDNCPF